MSDPNVSDPLDATSIQIIDAGYRSVNDPTAFDDLVLAWKARIDAVRDGQANKLLSPALEQHCEQLVKLLDTFQDTLHLNEHDTFVRQAMGPAFVLSPNGTVIALNEAAASFFGLAVGQRSNLDMFAEESRIALRAIRETCGNRGNTSRAILRCEGDDEHLRLVDARIIATRGQTDPAIALKLIGFDWSDSIQDLMMLAFDLSAAEAQVVGLLYRHADLGVVAEARGTSVRTVRTQLHQVFEKTGVGGQVELIRMVSLICAQESGRNSPLAEWRDPLGREHFFLDQSGRKICWTWMGAERGKPAILCHGPMTGNILLPELEDYLRSAGVKLYAIVRPGFGQSDPGETGDAQHDGADAILALAQHLELKQTVGIGLVNGIIPLLYARRKNPAYIRRLLCVGSSIPVAALETDKLPKMQSTIYQLAESSQDAFDAFSRTGYRAVMSSGPEYFLSRMYEGSPADQQLLKNQDVFALLKSSTSMVVTQGYKAFYQDMMMSMFDFSEALDGEANLTMLAGTQDPVYDLSRVLRYARNMGFEAIQVPEAGQMICHSHYELVAQMIVDSINGTSEH